MIKKEIIKAIKEESDLTAYIESRGIKLTKKGKNRVGLCPFHEDKTPSLTINTTDNLWQCFGCGAGGDIIRFVEMLDNVDFPTAMGTLSGIKFKKGSSKKAVKDKKPAGLTVKSKKLLARVVTYYQHIFREDPLGFAYLKETRGIKESSSFEAFGTGFVNGTLLSILPEDPEVTKSLKEMGVLNKNGKEFFFNCVVFPLLNEQGAVVSLYGRNVDDESEIKHLYLKGPRKGIINRSTANRSETVILTESIIDALTLYDQGFKNVIPLYGVNGLTEDHLLLFNRAVKCAYLVFDADQAGRDGAQRTKEQLKKKEIITHIVDLPSKDVNLFFNRHTPEDFEQLLKQSNPASVEQSESIKKRAQTFYEKKETGFITGFDTREYEIKGIQRNTTQLKVTVKASKDIRGTRGNTPFELTTLDLYSSRSRTFFARMCVDLFGEPETLLKDDVGKLMQLVEEFARDKPEKQAEDKTSKQDKEKALRFLKNPDMFAEILEDLEITGIIGEETNKLVSYLATISRKLDDPLSVLVQSRSAAGKSTLQDAVLALVPEEDYVKYTRITDQALFYKEEDSLVNKILAIEEAEGMGGAAYSIRNIQTSKKITVAATGKDPGTGKMRTEEYTVKGPICVMITTTAAELEGETASRFLFLTIDESSKMTAAIHKKQRESDTLEGLVNKTRSESIINKHHAAQRMLQPLAVVNPYTEYLNYPSGSLRTRRDHKKYLGLIKTVTFLHQHQRDIKEIKADGQVIKYIEVTLSDIEKANRLADEVLGQCLDDLAKPSRTLLETIYKMVKEQVGSDETENNEVEDFFFNRRMVREYIGWTDWQIRAHIKQLEELEYLYARAGHRGKEYAYALNYNGEGEGKERFYLNLTSVEDIGEQLKKKEEVCAS